MCHVIIAKRRPSWISGFDKLLKTAKIDRTLTETSTSLKQAKNVLFQKR